MEVGFGTIVSDLATGNDRVSGHDLSILFDQADHVRVIEAEHASLCILKANRAFELVPEQSPESCTVVLATGDALVAKVELGLDDLSNGLFLNGG